MVLGHDGLGFVRLRRPMREGRRAGGLFRFRSRALRWRMASRRACCASCVAFRGGAGELGRRDNVHHMAARITLKAINQELAGLGTQRGWPAAAGISVSSSERQPGGWIARFR